MSGIASALQELRVERKQAQAHLEKLDEAISVMESLNGAGAAVKTTTHTRVISAASRRKMALAQKARWDKVRREGKPAVVVSRTAAGVPAKRTMSAEARKKIAAAQRARWATVRAKEKKAA